MFPKILRQCVFLFFLNMINPASWWKFHVNNIRTKSMYVSWVSILLTLNTHFEVYIPIRYLLVQSDKNTKTIFDICSKLTIITYIYFTVNFEHILHLLFVSIVNFEQVNANWIGPWQMLTMDFFLQKKGCFHSPIIDDR